MMDCVDAILDDREPRRDVMFLGLGDSDYRIRVSQCRWNQDPVRQSESRSVCFRVKPIGQIVDRNYSGAKERSEQRMNVSG
jgi:hypothetical protein